jgi:hypothetical protein
MARKLKPAVCIHCNETFEPKSLKQTMYCSISCGNHERNGRKKDIRDARKRNLQILDGLKLEKLKKHPIQRNRLVEAGFRAELYDSAQKIPVANSMAISTICYYGHYQLFNENGNLYIINF